MNLLIFGSLYSQTKDKLNEPILQHVIKMAISNLYENRKTGNAIDWTNIKSNDVDMNYVNIFRNRRGLYQEAKFINQDCLEVLDGQAQEKISDRLFELKESVYNYSSIPNTNFYCDRPTDENKTIYFFPNNSTLLTPNDLKPMLQGFYAKNYMSFLFILEKIQEREFGSVQSISNRIHLSPKKDFINNLPILYILYMMSVTFCFTVSNGFSGMYQKVYENKTHDYLNFHRISYFYQIMMLGSLVTLLSSVSLIGPIYLIRIIYNLTNKEVVIISIIYCIILVGSFFQTLCLKIIFNLFSSSFDLFITNFLPLGITYLLETLRIKEGVGGLDIFLYFIPFYQFFQYLFALNSFKTKLKRELSYEDLWKHYFDGHRLIVPLIVYLVINLILLFFTDLFLGNHLNLNTFLNFFRTMKPLKKKMIKSGNELFIDSLNKSYYNFLSEFKALKNISFSVKKGEKIALLGPNGSGKTSLFECLVGFEKINYGRIIYKKKDFLKSRSKIKVGYCPQFSYFINDLTVRENIDVIMLLYNIHKKNLYEAMRKLDLLKTLHNKVKKCSGGEKRKLSFLLSIIFKPEILFLDEPTTGVDPLSKKEMKKLVDQYCSDSIVFISSHLIDDIEGFSNKIVILNEGSMEIIGAPNEILKHYQLKKFKLHLNFPYNQDRKEIVNEVRKIAPDSVMDEELKENKVILSIDELNDLEIHDSTQFLESIVENNKLNSFILKKAPIEEIFKLKSFGKSDKNKEKKKNKLIHKEEKSKTKIEENNTLNVFNNKKKISPIWGLIYSVYLKFKNDRTLQLLLISSNLIIYFILRYLVNDDDKKEISFEKFGRKNIEVLLRANQDTSKEFESFVEKNYNEILKLKMASDQDSFHGILGYQKNPSIEIREHVILVYQNTFDEISFLINEILFNFIKFRNSQNSEKVSFKIKFSPKLEPSYASFNQERFELHILLIQIMIDTINSVSNYLFERLILLKYFSYGVPVYFSFIITYITTTAIFTALFSVSFFSIFIFSKESIFKREFIEILINLSSIIVSIISVNLFFLNFLPRYLISMINLATTLFNEFKDNPKLDFLKGDNFFARCLAFIIDVNPISDFTKFFKHLGKIKRYNLNIGNYGGSSDTEYKAHTSILNSQIITSVVINLLVILIVKEFRQRLHQFIFTRQRNKIIQKLKKNHPEKVISSKDKIKSKDKMIEFKSVYKFQNKQYFKSTPVLKGVSFKLAKGSTIAVLGPNGSGKTTSFRIALSELMSDSGQVFIRNKKSRFLCHPQISYVPQFEHFDPINTVSEILFIYSMLSGRSYFLSFLTVKKVIKIVRLEKNKNKRFGDLSGGNKRKVSLAVAFLKSEDLFMLDEPTTGVDIKSSIDIWKGINQLIKRGCSLIMASHSMVETEELARKIILLIDGKVFDINTPEFLRNTYGGRLNFKIEVSKSRKDIKGFKKLFTEKFGKYENFSFVGNYIEVLINKKRKPLSHYIGKMIELKNESPVKSFFIQPEGLDEVLATILKKRKK